MIQGIRTWMMAIVSVSVLVSIVQTLAPDGTMKKVISLTGGLLLLIALIYPLKHLDWSQLKPNRSDYENEIKDRQTELEENGQETMASIIEKKTAAYISDKAGSLGISCSVSVTTKIGEDGVPRPDTATLSCPKSEALASYMEQELAIPKERQVWNVTENSS
jgi:stage III sporulation protein AF